MDSDHDTTDFVSEAAVDDVNVDLEDDIQAFELVSLDSLSEWSMIEDSHQCKSVHNRTQHWAQLQSSQRGSHITPNRSFGTPRLHRSLHAPSRSLSSLSRPDTPTSRPASIQVRPTSSGKPRPKSGLRRPLSLHPQSSDDVSQRHLEVSNASIVSHENPPIKKQKLPLKAPSSGMVQLTRVAHASRCPVV